MWIVKIPHFTIGVFSFWYYLWWWNPAAVVNRDLNRISQRGGSGEQAQSQSSVPGLYRLTANGRFEKRQSTVKKKKNRTKILGSCSSRTIEFSLFYYTMYSLLSHKNSKSKSMVLLHIWRSFLHSLRRYMTSNSALILNLLYAQSGTDTSWQNMHNNNCFPHFKFKQDNVKQPTAGTISRTPIHTLSCILEYTMVQFPWRGRLTEFGECSVSGAKDKQLKFFTFCVSTAAMQIFHLKMLQTFPFFFLQSYLEDWDW